MERLSIRRIATATVPLALLLAACGDDEVTVRDAETDRVENVNPANDVNISVEAVYHENGTRTLRYINDDDYYADLFQICDGRDLLEQTAEHGMRADGRSGNAPERSVGHPACADGILTPQDFALGL